MVSIKQTNQTNQTKRLWFSLLSCTNMEYMLSKYRNTKIKNAS